MALFLDQGPNGGLRIARIGPLPTIGSKNVIGDRIKPVVLKISSPAHPRFTFVSVTNPAATPDATLHMARFSVERFVYGYARRVNRVMSAHKRKSPASRCAKPGSDALRKVVRCFGSREAYSFQRGCPRGAERGCDHWRRVYISSRRAWLPPPGSQASLRRYRSITVC